MTLAPTHVEHALQQIKGHYLEMPGLSLTAKQAQRLYGLEADVCLILFEALEDARFLRRRPNGTFVRCELDAADS